MKRLLLYIQLTLLSCSVFSQNNRFYNLEDYQKWTDNTRSTTGTIKGIINTTLNITFIDKQDIGDIVFLQDGEGNAMQFLYKGNLEDSLFNERCLQEIVAISIVSDLGKENQLVDFKIIDQGVCSTNPERVSIEEILIHPINFKDKLVNLEDIETDAGGLYFTPNKKYTLYQNGNKLALVTDFSNVDYFGMPIPERPSSITGIVKINPVTEEVYLTPRSHEDITSSIDFKRINEQHIYTHDGFLIIETESPITLEVYTLLGTLIINTRVSEGFHEIAIDEPGIYIVKTNYGTKKISIE